MMITFRHLRYFEALSRHRHFGRAAEECSVTQPALSMQMRELETLLGTPLIERRRGDVQLTEVGHEVARRARDILATVLDLTEFTRRTSGPLSGPFVLGAEPSIARYLIPGTLPQIKAGFPALELTLRETMTGALVGELISGRIDAILVSLPLEHPDIETLPLFDEHLLYVTPAQNHGNPPSHMLSPSLVAADQLVLLEDGHSLREQVLSYCNVPPALVRQQNGASNLSTLVQLIANGYGVTLLPEMAAAVEVAEDTRVNLSRFRDPVPLRTIGLAWRRSSPRTNDFHALGEIIGAAGQQLIERCRGRLPLVEDMQPTRIAS
ncbi:hydrogen peroxide-inducible genes activator [Chelatococcus sp. HY11]|uniref:hydrogen peroxide-inducible genes activator n=2 Tax=Chelatococcus TaxID=28209 RepID=UPI00224BC298|nr:Hydrogen peroxide-inducible genes activator [Hyphomicrobiales bacterium]CAH1676896.1 Hydrogen peroxide-inducible genes activator [Hyphomicrobiales bacterium]